ncbi:peptidoglycan-binding domain-containing protein [Streptomyces antimycoticus]|nr:peptidoglycan-binding domain-containing protein [Streptomyces antimycoticus]
MTEGQEPEQVADLRPGRTRHRGSRARRAAVAAGVVAAIVAAGTALAVRPWTNGGGKSAPEHGPRSTASVQRASLTSGLRLDGELGHGTVDEVTAQGQGTFTKLPKAGDRVETGKPLYEVDARPVVLFHGPRPFWRDLARGVGDGPDIRELERNLTDLGYANAANLTVDEEFTEGTAAAVKRWQKALGLKQTGKVEQGRVVVLPHRAVRVQEVVAKLGATVGAGSGGTVLKVTTPDVYATVKPDEDQLAQLAPGSKVTVELEAGAASRARSPPSHGSPERGTEEARAAPAGRVARPSPRCPSAWPTRRRPGPPCTPAAPVPPSPCRRKRRRTSSSSR